MPQSNPDDPKCLPSAQSLAEALNAIRNPQIFKQQFKAILTEALEAGISKETLGVVFDKLSETNIILAAKMMEQVNPDAINTARRARAYLTSLMTRETLGTLAQRIRGEIVVREERSATGSGSYDMLSARKESVNEGVWVRLQSWIRKALGRHG